MGLLDIRTLRVAATLLAVAGALALVYFLGKVLFLLVLAVVFAYLIFPLVRVVERGIPVARRRSIAIAVVYLALLAAISTLAALVGPRLGRELTALSRKIPEMSAQIESGRVVSHIFPNWSGAGVLDGLIESHLPAVVGYAQYALTSALAWASGAWVVILVPIFGFFFLRDAEQIADTAIDLIDNERWRQLSLTIARDFHTLLGEYIRALILLCVLTFSVWSAVFRVAGVPYAMVLAAIGGSLEFLPMLGPVVAAVIVIGVALFSGFAHPWLLILFVVAWRLCQDYVSSPLIMGRGVELHPGLVIFGVLAGGELAGPAGMFFSIPVMAGLRVAWRRLRDFRGDGQSVAAAVPESEPRHGGAVDR